MDGRDGNVPRREGSHLDLHRVLVVCSGSAMRSCLFVVSVCNVMVRLVEEPCIKSYLCLRMALGQVNRMLYCALVVTCNAVVEL